MTDKVYYCNEDDVRRLLGLDSTAVSNDDVLQFIKMAQDEVDTLTHTKFLKIQSSGTATSATASTLTDNTKTWIDDEWNADTNLVGGYMVHIFAGTGAGQVRAIIDNTATELTVSPNFDITPDTDSEYRIFKNTYVNETFTGDATDIYFTNQYPLLGDILSMSLDDTDIDVDDLYVTDSQGKVQLKHTADKVLYPKEYPLLCNIKYFYGVYPVDEVVRDLTATSAAIILATYMIGGTYTFATSYSVPDMSVSKGVPYPHFNTAIIKLEEKRKWLMANIMNKIARPMFA
jgi:hypothetical protein